MPIVEMAMVLGGRDIVLALVQMGDQVLNSTRLAIMFGMQTVEIAIAPKKQSKLGEQSPNRTETTGHAR